MLFAVLTGIASGLLAYIAFPPVDIGPAAYVALVPLALLFRLGTLGQVLAGTALFCFTFFGLLLFWMADLTLAGYLAVVPALSLYFVFFALIGHMSQRAFPGWSWLIFALSFLAADYVRTLFPLGGFPWGGLGYSQHDNWTMLRLAPYTGVWGLTVTLLLINSLIAQAVHVLLSDRRRPLLASYGASALAMGLFPMLLPEGDLPDGNAARVAMVQGNVPEGTVDPHSDDPEVLQNHIDLSRTITGPRPSLVVWPEGALDRDPFLHPPSGNALIDIIEEIKSPFLVGGWARSPDGQNRNASLFFDQDAVLQGVYVKRKLVPFGEWVPFRRVLEPLIKDISRVPMDLTAGTEATVFSLPEGRFASVICYESTYPGLARSLVRNGARFLVVSTNNSSFGRTAMSDQHLVFSQLRAAEHRMWLTHVGVSGISAVIAPDGQILERSKLFEPALMTPSIRFATSVTPYARWGDWVPIAGVAALAALFLTMVRSFVSVRRGGGPPG